MKSTRHIVIIKHSVYGALLLLFYVLQTTPGLFAVAGIKPMLAVPVAIAVAMVEGEFVGGVYGALAGLLCDVGSTMLFGFNGLFVSFFCVTAGLLVIYLMHCNAGGATLFVFAAMLARGGVEYLFGYHMWGYENVWKVFAFRVLPVVLYTTLVTPLVFLCVRGIHRRFRRRLVVE